MIEKLISNPKTPVQQVLERIVNVFAGYDGGVSFVKLRFFLEDLERQANDGDKPAQQIIEVVNQFDRLLSCATDKNDDFRKRSS